MWVLDKLILSRMLGYSCGPASMDVPEPGWYVVRPCVNAAGMGAGAKEMRLERETDHLPPGHFWCEWIQGEHYSVDYQHGKQILSVQGYLTSSKDLSRWEAWYLRDKQFPLPHILKDLAKKYEYINVEYIDRHPIEVHLRQNPDWMLAEDIVELRPVWQGQAVGIDTSKYTYIPSPDGDRKGFYAKFR
jgi:hypothetical protein